MMNGILNKRLGSHRVTNVSAVGCMIVEVDFGINWQDNSKDQH
jgi:hypothetical protein